MRRSRSSLRLPRVINLGDLAAFVIASRAFKDPLLVARRLGFDAREQHLRAALGAEWTGDQIPMPGDWIVESHVGPSALIPGYHEPRPVNNLGSSRDGEARMTKAAVQSTSGPAP